MCIFFFLLYRNTHVSIDHPGCWDRGCIPGCARQQARYLRAGGGAPLTTAHLEEQDHCTNSSLPTTWCSSHWGNPAEEGAEGWGCGEVGQEEGSSEEKTTETWGRRVRTAAAAVPAAAAAAAMMRQKRWEKATEKDWIRRTSLTWGGGEQPKLKKRQRLRWETKTVGRRRRRKKWRLKQVEKMARIIKWPSRNPPKPGGTHQPSSPN